MTLELDHVFIMVDVGGPEANRLAEFGLTEGAPNTHPGQGTACRRFFFQNAYLELLWVDDPIAAQAEAIGPTHLWTRWSRQETGACRFGLIFRPEEAGAREVPFQSWEYRAPYLPPALSLWV